MRNESAAGQYAQVLLAIARERGQADHVLRQVRACAQVFQDRLIWRFLESPKIKREDKEAMLEKLLEGRSSGDEDLLFLNFARMLLKRARIVYLKTVFKRYEEIYTIATGVLPGRLWVAHPVGQDMVDRIGAAIGSKIGKRFILATVDAPEILGGFVFSSGTFFIDASVRGHLARLKAHLTDPSNPGRT